MGLEKPGFWQKSGFAGKDYRRNPVSWSGSGIILLLNRKTSQDPATYGMARH